MKKKLAYIIVILFVIAAIFAWMFFGEATSFSSEQKYIYVYDNRSVKEQVLTQFDTGNYVSNAWLFKLVAPKLKVWQRLKPGRFEIKKGMSLFDVVRMFRNNTQSPVRLTIKKLRTAEDVAKVLGKNFINDSAEVYRFVTSNDSLNGFGVDTNTINTLIIPDTYIIKWNTPVKKLLQRLQSEEENFWNKNNRLQKAAAMNFSTEQVYTLASIVEEETNKNDEKGNIASVYINRLNKGMYLGADPTIKFALKDFALKRIYLKYLDVPSPYNTYRNKGLPPGPVCTPSQATIDAVLDAPKTDYIFFVAKSDFSGYHHFSSNYAEHEQYAKIYQQALDAWMEKQNNK